MASFLSRTTRRRGGEQSNSSNNGQGSNLSIELRRIFSVKLIPDARSLNIGLQRPLSLNSGSFSHDRFVTIPEGLPCRASARTAGWLGPGRRPRVRRVGFHGREPPPEHGL